MSEHIPYGGTLTNAKTTSLNAAAQSRTHTHRFDTGNPLAERNTRRAMWLTAVMMVVEIAGGWWFWPTAGI